MFYDLPDPVKFAKDVKSILDDNGIWHIELSYMPLMLNMNSYDTICHEHLEYYSLKSLKYLMDMVGLKIIKISFNNINGGSIAIDVAKKNIPLIKRYLKNKINIKCRKKKKIQRNKYPKKIFCKL